MKLTDSYSHDGTYRSRGGFDCELMQPHDPSDDEERPITNDMLKAWARGQIMHWRDARRVVGELLRARAFLAKLERETRNATDEILWQGARAEIHALLRRGRDGQV